MIHQTRKQGTRLNMVVTFSKRRLCHGVAQGFWTRAGRSVCLLILFLISAAISPVDRGIHFSVEYKSSQNRKARGLALETTSERGYISLLLIEGPSLQLVTLMGVIDPAKGTRRNRITDRTTGWWIEMIEDYETSWSRPGTALGSIGRGPDEENNKFSLRLTLRTSDDFNFETTLARLRRGPVQELSQALEKQEQRRLLADSVPSPVREVIHLLKEALAAEDNPERMVGVGSTDLLAISEWAFGIDGGTSGQEGETWKIGESWDTHLGLTPTEPEQIELVSKFPSLENTDPMRGMRLADLFPADDPER
jgi:hypothetical protein